MATHDQGGCSPRCQTKKALKEVVRDIPDKLYLSTTSMFPGGYSGRAVDMPDDLTFTVVGPDPHTRRNWYANVKKKADGSLVVT